MTPPPVPAAYWSCIHLPCPSCSSPAGEFCRNPINHLPSRIPCVARGRIESENR